MERNDRQTMERIMKWAVALIATSLLSGCGGNSYHPEFQGLPHKGRHTVTVIGLHIDTLFIDGSSTSLMGDWIQKGDRLYFVDQSLCGLRCFDLNGEYLGRHIRSGRGPNEWPSSFVKAKFHRDELVAVDGNWFFTVYDSSYVRQGEPFNLLESYGLGNSGWQDLLRHPDVEAPAMYEYNLEASNIVKAGDMFVIPVVTEHVNYNGLSRTSNSRDFWRRSYTFMRLDVHGGGTTELFGHYPEIYTEKNIPIFASYSFDRCEDGIVTSYGPPARHHHFSQGAHTTASLQTERLHRIFYFKTQQKGLFPYENSPFLFLDLNSLQLLAGIFDVRLCSLSFALCDRLPVWHYAVIARLYPIYLSAVAVVFNFDFVTFFPYHSLVI